jgi:hypothetical protein
MTRLTIVVTIAFLLMMCWCGILSMRVSSLEQDVQLLNQSVVSLANDIVKSSDSIISLSRAIKSNSDSIRIIAGVK